MGEKLMEIKKLGWRKTIKGDEGENEGGKAGGVRVGKASNVKETKKIRGEEV